VSESEVKRVLEGDALDRLDRLADSDADRVLIVELMDGVKESGSLSAGSLRARSAAVAASLGERDIVAGDVVLLIASSPVECLVGLFGCFRAGVIAAPIAFPRRPEHLETRLEPVRANAGAVAVLAGTPQDDAEREVLALLSNRELPVLHTDLTPALPPVAGVAAEARDLAYLQYTSGSTSDPKGVVVTHDNLVANFACIAERLGIDERSVIVNWNPLTHDMGLIMGALPAIAYGASVVLMPPGAFIRHPLSWLRAVDRYRGTHGYSPNFGYDLLVERTTPEQRAALDLSSLTCLLNGAEQVRLRTRERFFEAFAESGVHRSAWRTAWGLAESTVLVSGTPVGAEAPVVWVDAAALEDRRVVVVPEAAAGARSLCGDGVAASGYEIAIVDESTNERVAPDRVGEVWVRGPSVSPGYWHRPEETVATFGATIAGEVDQWLRTGDLGFLYGDEIVFCGRLKDLIVMSGRNLHPQDIELTADLAHDAVRPGGVAAFAIDTEEGDAIVVLAEVEDPADDVLGADVRTAVRRAVLREFEVRVADVVLVGPRGVPKTSSGKVQRAASREIYERHRS
jgi:acyl-CoA synthetase (AMP-forming)/AMP-acid ligase II